MARGVGPKNTRTRETGWFSQFNWNQYLPTGFSWIGVLFRRMGIILLLGLIGFVFYDFYRFGRTSPRFSVKIEIKGNQLIDDQQVRTTMDAYFGKEQQTSLLTISAQGIRDHLSRKIPRFKNIHIVQKFPNRLVVNVEERVPVAIVARLDKKNDRRIFLPADRKGVLFEAQREEWDQLRQTLPVVLGLEDLPRDSKNFERHWKQAMKVKNEFEKVFVSDMLNWIQIRPGGFAEVQIDKPRELVIKLGLDRYHQKFEQLNEMMMTEQFRSIEKYVNFRDENEVLVK